MNVSHFSRWTNRWTLRLWGMFGERGGYCETGRPGYSQLSPSQCSCNFPALQGLVETCLWTWQDGYTWESWWQVLTSIIRAGCNIRRNHGYLKILFWVRSWCDWRATTVVRTGRRQSWDAGSSFQLSEARPAHRSALLNIPHPLQVPCPCSSSTKPWAKGKEKENAQRKQCKEAEGQKLRERRENQSQ